MNMTYRGTLRMLISGCLNKTNFFLHLCDRLRFRLLPCKKMQLKQIKVCILMCVVPLMWPFVNPSAPFLWTRDSSLNPTPSDRGQHVLTRQPSKTASTNARSHSLRYAALCTHWLAHTRTSEHTSAQHTVTHFWYTHAQTSHSWVGAYSIGWS